MRYLGRPAPYMMANVTIGGERTVNYLEATVTSDQAGRRGLRPDLPMGVVVGAT